MLERSAARRGSAATSVAAVDRLARRSGSRRRRAAPSARAGRSGRSRCAARTRAGRSPRSRRGSPSRGRRRASRGCSAGRRRRGRRARRRAAAGRRARAATCSRSSPKVSSSGPRVCERATTATRAEVLVAPDRVLGVVEARAGEPLGARHRVRVEHALVRRGRRISKKSQSDPQNPSRSVTDQRHSSS